MRTHLLLRAFPFAGFLLGLTATSEAFTLINPLDPIVRKMSVGAPPADGASQMSTGARYSVSDLAGSCAVVFTSTATNLMTGQVDSNGTSDVFLYDCTTDSVTLVSHAGGKPPQAAAGASDQPVISPDGKFVVFRSTATDIVPGTYTVGRTNVFLWDRQNDIFTLVSRAFAGPTIAGDGNSQNGVISRANGSSIVAFQSLATNLVAPGMDTNGVSDIFRFSGGTVIRVSFPNTGAVEANGGSVNPAIDSSGNCIVFQSAASNLVSTVPADDANGVADVFRWLSGANPIILLSHQPGQPTVAGTVTAGSAASTEPSVSDDCSSFAFKSLATNLVAGQVDNNSGNDIFYERSGSDAILVSHQDVDTTSTRTGSDVSAAPILSRDGNWIAYASLAVDLAPSQNDAAGTSDVFVYSVASKKNALVSHTAGDPTTVASAQSFAPEISIDGDYIAFASDAKDIDPNQNDANGARDIFLYNRRWNSSVLASRRFASISITGDGRSIVPALSGDGYLVAFTSNSDDLIADDPETAGLDDVFYFRSLGLLNYASVRSTQSQNTLEWITPATNIVSMQVWATPGTTCPANLAAASAGTPVPTGPQFSNSSFISGDPNVYAAGTDLCYTFFIQRDSGPLVGASTPSKSVLARTVEGPAASVKWASNMANIAALAQVGIGATNLIAVANEGGVYGLNRGATGGTWAIGYWPFRTDFSPIQGRPGVQNLSVKGAGNVAFVGSQDGRVYAYDADRGAHAGGALWYTSPALAATPTLDSIVQPAVAGMFIHFGGVGDHLLVGARPTTGPSPFFALDPATGAQRPGSPFTGGVNSIGAVSTTASVDYTKSQVYFTSLEFAAGQPSLWCLKLTASGLGGSCWSQTSPSGINGGAIERNGTVYVGDNSGQVWAFDASSGASHWPGPYVACGGATAIKSYVLADRLGASQDLYYATSSQLCAATDLGASAATKWSLATIPGPSAPVLVRILGTAYLYVGSSDGNLYQVDPTTTATKKVLIRTGATIGAPAFDQRDSMIYVGSDAGAIYAVQAPLP